MTEREKENLCCLISGLDEKEKEIARNILCSNMIEELRNLKNEDTNHILNKYLGIGSD